MSASIGIVKQITGTVFVIDANGNKRSLKVGDEIILGEIIKTEGESSNAIITLNNGKDITILGNDELALDQGLINSGSESNVMAGISDLVDVQKLDADFYAFSAHKMYGPTGVGVLMGKLQSLAQIQPLIFGGKMLQNVTEQQLTLAELPYRLEAGTPNIAGIIGFGKVLEWLEKWDFQQLNQGLYHLATQMRERLESYPNIQILGNAISPTISFTFSNQHHADLATILAEQKIALRSGEHCAKPYLRYLAKTGTLRLSLAHYNVPDDLNQFFDALDSTLVILQD